MPLVSERLRELAEALSTPELAELAKQVRRYEHTLYGDPGDGAICGAFFLDHVDSARDGGYYLACAKCGNGMDAVDEDDDLHDEGCPNRGADPFADQVAFLTERLGPEKTAEIVARALEAPVDEASSGA